MKQVGYGKRSFNTQPPEGGWLKVGGLMFRFVGFQHTAARRRLVDQINDRR